MYRRINQTVRAIASNIRHTLFTWRLEREINQQIFPHLNNAKNGNYPFKTDEELWKKVHHSNLDAKLLIETIERQADQMGEAYGMAFRYIMYRDLNARMRTYAKLAQHRVPPPLRVPRFA